MLNESSFAHKGLRRFWVSGGEDCSDIGGVSASPLRDILVHLGSAYNEKDLFFGLGTQKRVERLKGMRNRFSMRANANMRITFTFQQGIGATKVDLEDTHRATGAKKR